MRETIDIDTCQAAAERGHVQAQVLMGWAYEHGHGVPRDLPLAASWYRRAAEQGNPDVQYMLGLLYAEGRGVTRDYSMAAYWWQTAGFQFLRTGQPDKARCCALAISLLAPYLPDPSFGNDLFAQLGVRP